MEKIAEMVGSAVVQEAVSGAFLFLCNNREEFASQSRLVERLNMAYLDLKFALERSGRMPIAEVSLLERRMMIKHAFEECRDLLNKHTVLRVQPLSPSLPRRIVRALKPFFSTGKGSISAYCVARFELFAEKADKFLRDVESGCSLALYRFSSPLITQLLEGKYVYYRMVRGSQTLMLSIYPSFLEDYGAVAYLAFVLEDLDTPVKCYRVKLMLRLSESTDIVGISNKCLESLEPQFKHVADVASGELAQISTQVGFFTPEQAKQEYWFNFTAKCSRSFRQEPLCCIGDGFQPCAKNTLLSELTERFPEQVSYLEFVCFISAVEYSRKKEAAEYSREEEAAEYNLQSSSSPETNNKNTIKAWPVLQLSLVFLPHCLRKSEDDKAHTYGLTSRGNVCGPFDCLDLSEMATSVPVIALHFFKLRPKRTKFTMFWFSPHGRAGFAVSKPKVGNGPKTQTRRASKRKR